MTGGAGATGRPPAGQSPIGVPRHVTDLGGGRTLAWAQTGAGADLVALHGTLMTLDEMWLGPVPALARHFRVTAVDRPGHGLSRRRRYLDASPWRQATLIHDALAAIGIERPVLLGHSYGGAVALAYAQLFPDALAGVVAVAPLCRPEPRIEQALFGPRALPGTGALVAAAAAATTDAVLLPLLRRAIFLPQAVPAAFAEAFPTALTDNVDAMIAEGEDALAPIPDLTRPQPPDMLIRTPVRFLGGTADLVINNAIHGQVAANFLPDARFAWVAGMGHMLHHFAVDEVVAATVALSGRATDAHAARKG